MKLGGCWVPLREQQLGEVQGIQDALLSCQVPGAEPQIQNTGLKASAQPKACATAGRRSCQTGKYALHTRKWPRRAREQFATFRCSCY